MATKTETISCRLTEEDKLILLQMAEKHEWTLSKLVQKILKEYIEKENR